MQISFIPRVHLYISKESSSDRFQLDKSRVVPQSNRTLEAVLSILHLNDGISVLSYQLLLVMITFLLNLSVIHSSDMDLLPLKRVNNQQGHSRFTVTGRDKLTLSRYQHPTLSSFCSVLLSYQSNI